MLKEIHDQSAVLRAVMRGRIRTNSVVGIHVPMVPDLIRIVACGTAYYAGMMTRFLIERLSGIPVIVDHAHEFRYHTPTGRNTLVIGISQSGETADTIAAMTAASERDSRPLRSSIGPTRPSPAWRVRSWTSVQGRRSALPQPRRSQDK